MEDFAGKMSRINSSANVEVVNIDEILPKYRKIFQYPYFNKVQSMVIPDVLYSDKSIVVSAPTGSGKTVILELAIIRLLMNLDQLNYKGDFKIVYMAPVKALCTERLMDWYGKFSQLGLPCIEVTGDTDLLDIANLKSYKIIMTTPEKWDTLTRRWKDHEKIVQMVKLFLIDEVHLLKEDIRGPVLEAVVSRMKTIQESLNLSTIQNRTLDSTSALSLNIRFIAISATIPNAHDIAEWLGTRQQPAPAFVIGEEFRPVQLIKIVEGFPFKDGLGLFKFDMGLSYKIRPIIERHCEGKPTLIFCNTRKSVEMTADILSKDLLFQFTDEQREIFYATSSQITDKKLQKLVQSGIGCHHAGFIQHDRNIVEHMFRQGDLPVLITTSTLAMGVNLPAHLVIIKTTQYYNNGTYQEYEESTVLQMMGRAGRPQFDNQGVAVIMTRNQDKERYDRLVGGHRAIESSLHRHLSEHLNAEVALGTLPDLLQAMDWIRSTFLYIRAVKNPMYYGFPSHIHRDAIEKRLEELCLKCMNALARAGMLIMDSNTRVESTEAGLVMAANCLDFETMKLIMKIKGSESLNELIETLSQCHEFGDLPLRSGEKRVLNLLNRKPRGQDGAVCRFPQRGRIQSRDMKINCLIQAMFGCLPVPDPSLHQEVMKISRIGEHLSKCIMKYLTRPSSINNDRPKYKAVLNSVILAKCFITKLWENSPYVVRQFSGIGAAFASLLASSGKTTFQSILESNPRDLERIISKQPPAGNLLKKQVSLLPIYDLKVLFKQTRTILLTLTINNAEELLNKGSTVGDKHRISLIVGDSENNLLLYENVSDYSLLRGPTSTLSKEIIPTVLEAHTIYAHCISNTWVGIDVSCSVEIKKSMNSVLGPLQRNIINYIEKTQTKMNAANHKNTTIPITLSPATQNSFLTDMDQDHNESNGMKKNTNKTPSVKKPIEKKSCDKSVRKINTLIKTIPDPSQLNTLSHNVTYYKPLPKQIQQVNRNNDVPNPSPELNTSFTLPDDYENSASLQTFEKSIPQYLQNFYSRNDDCFDSWCSELEKPIDKKATPPIRVECYMGNSEYSDIFNSDLPSTSYQTLDSCYQEIHPQNKSVHPIANIDQENEDEFYYSPAPAIVENNLLKITEEYETFALDQIDDITNIRKPNNFDENLMNDNANNKITSMSEFEEREMEQQMDIVAKNIDMNVYATKNIKTAPKTMAKRDNTINNYYKQVKKFTNSPNSKRMKLDIQYKSPPTKHNDENVVELIVSSPVTQHKSKFSKFCTGQNKINEKMPYTGESKFKSVGTNTDPEVKNMVDSSQQTITTQISDKDYKEMMPVAQNSDKQISLNYRNKNYEQHETKMATAHQDFANGIDNTIEELKEIPSEKGIEIYLQININETYNQLFYQSDSDESPKLASMLTNISKPSVDIKENKQCSAIKNKSVTWSKPLIKCIVEEQHPLQVEYKSRAIEETDSENNNPIQLLQKCAISKIKEKMQSICETKNIPTNVKVNFLNAIKSITNLSSDKFMQLYSIKKLNALQDIAKTSCLDTNPKTTEISADTSDQMNQRSPTETGVVLEDITESDKMTPSDPKLSIEEIMETNVESSDAYFKPSNEIEHPVANTKDVLLYEKDDESQENKNKRELTKFGSNNKKIMNVDDNKIVSKLETNIQKKTDSLEYRNKNEVTQMKPNHRKSDSTEHKILNSPSNENNSSVIKNSRSDLHTQNNAFMTQTESIKSKVDDRTQDNQKTKVNVASILQQFAPSNLSKSGHIAKNITSTERSNFCNAKMNNPDKNTTPTQNMPSIRSFLNSPRNEDIPKYYRDEFCNSQVSIPPNDRSYMQSAFQCYKFDNQPQCVFGVEDDNMEDDSCEILEENIFDSDNKYQANFEDTEVDENILNPQKVLALTCDKQNIEKPKEIVYLENEDFTQNYYGTENNVNASNTYIENSFPRLNFPTHNTFSNNYECGNRKPSRIIRNGNSFQKTPPGKLSRNDILHFQQYQNTSNMARLIPQNKLPRASKM